MATVTFDGRSFLIDGRRVWITSGSLHYARVPRALWADRIHAAKLTGMNTIETPVFWNRHEPRMGQFDFDGDNDIRHFVKLVHDAGMFLILRPGPFIDSGWDFGGLPTWLMNCDGIRFRTPNDAFLEASSRYISHLAQQVRDLQVTSAGKAGPILLVQNEMNWTCGDSTAATKYLGEVSRYLRESGFTVPVLNANNLWAGVEGEIDSWSGTESMLSMMRQMAAVRPEMPRMAINFRPEPLPAWGVEAPPPLHPAAIQRRLAEVLAAGAQYNLVPCIGGINKGFYAGRPSSAVGEFCTSTTGNRSPILPSGALGPTFTHVRRISMFSSAFGKVLAHLDPTYQPMSVDPGSVKPGGVAAVHTQGTQGSVLWVFGADPDRTGKLNTNTSASLLTPDGSTLQISLGDQAVAWLVMNTHLSGRALLDYSTLCALTHAGKTLVVYGPAGTSGTVSINGSPLSLTVPRGKTPMIEHHEGLTVVCLSEDLADRTFVLDGSVTIGADSITSAGDPVVLKSCSVTVIDADGKATSRTVRPTETRAPNIVVNEWAASSTDAYVNGTNPRFAAIDGPTQLSNAGTPEGYGWYKIIIKSSAPKKQKMSMPESADRLHVFVNGKPVGLWGVGPFATRTPVTLPLDKGENTVVILAENMGRAGAGSAIGERKGLFGHLYELKAFKPGRHTIELGKPVEPLKFRTPLWDVGDGDLVAPERITWQIAHRKKSPIFMTITARVGRGLVLLNDTPIHFVTGNGLERIVLDNETLGNGKNTLQISLLAESVPADMTLEQAYAEMVKGVSFDEGETNVTAGCEWSFAKWERPHATSFEPMGKTAITRGSSGPTGPTWWRCRFTSDETSVPAMLELSGMAKGQVYLNEMHVGKYFVSDGGRKSVGSDTTLYLPEPWILPGQTNELLVFDEHGGSPGKITIQHQTDATVIRA